MKKVLILLALVTLFSLACSNTYVGPNEKYGEDLQNVPVVTDNGVIPSSGLTINYETEERMKDVIWIAPGKVNVDRLYPGAQGEYTLRIHNPKNVPSTFSIYRRSPDSLSEGYSALPVQFQGWITATPSTLVVPAKSVGETLIRVQVGFLDKVSKNKYETWIGVMDVSQQGMVVNELCSRWLLTTK